jgi:choline dehydrogenase
MDPQPLGVYYPRGATLGGSAQSNAMNFALPPDDDWNIIAELTGDESWLAENVREHFIDMEKNQYLPSGTEGHGYDGYIGVRFQHEQSVGHADIA